MAIEEKNSFETQTIRKNERKNMGEKGRIRENDSKDKGIKRKGFIWFSY